MKLPVELLREWHPNNVQCKGEATLRDTRIKERRIIMWNVVSNLQMEVMTV